MLLDASPAASESIVVSSSMKRAMLEIIATGSASSVEDLKLYASCTLLSALHQVPDAALTACVDWLVVNEFIRRQQVGDGTQRLGPTQLGLASLASSLSPDESLVLLNELQTARRGIILDSDLHLVYQVLSAGSAFRLSPCNLTLIWCQTDNADLRIGPDEPNRLAPLSDALGGPERGPKASGSVLRSSVDSSQMDERCSHCRLSIGGIL